MFAIHKGVSGYSVSGDINASAVTCFNLEGNRFNGTRFTQAMAVNKSQTGALYFGVDTSMAKGAAPGTSLNFSEHLTVDAQTVAAASSAIKVSLEMSGARLPGDGVRDSWRLARLRWLDSTDGRDDEVSGGYIPTAVTDADPTWFKVDILNRTLVVSRLTGLPVSVVSNGREILAGPIEFVATTLDGTDVHCTAPAAAGAAAVPWQSDEAG